MTATQKETENVFKLLCLFLKSLYGCFWSVWICHLLLLLSKVLKPVSALVCGCFCACEETLMQRRVWGFHKDTCCHQVNVFSSVDISPGQCQTLFCAFYNFIGTECVWLTSLPAVHVYLMLKSCGASWRGKFSVAFSIGKKWQRSSEQLKSCIR